MILYKTKNALTGPDAKTFPVVWSRLTVKVWFYELFLWRMQSVCSKINFKIFEEFDFHIVKWHFSQSTFWTHLLWFVVTNYKYGKLMILIRASEKWSRYLSCWIILTGLVFSVSLLYYASTCFILEVLNTKCVSSFANMMHLFLFQTYL